MKSMRRGREFYSQNYEKVMELHKKGLSVQEIANELKMSYSAVYHWTRGLRKPDSGNIVKFVKFLADNGPTPVIEIEKKFPKHNEIFLTASRRGLKVKRHTLKRKFKDFAVWYFLEGQEKELEKRIENLFEALKSARNKLKKASGLNE